MKTKLNDRLKSETWLGSVVYKVVGYTGTTTSHDVPLDRIVHLELEQKPTFYLLAQRFISLPESLLDGRLELVR